MSQLQGLGQPQQGTSFEAHIQSVRLFMRYFAVLNLLIRGEETSDRMLAWATMDFLSNFLRILRGVRSRCTSRLECSSESAEQISYATVHTSCHGRGASSRRSPPSSSSIV